MSDEKKIIDPLEDIDPIMQEAFSSRAEDTVNMKATEVNSANQSEFAHQKITVSNVEFPELEESYEGKKLEKGVFSNIPVQVSVELGRSTISLKEIYDLSEGSIIELDRLVGEPLDLVINGQTIAQGEVVAIDNNFGLRIKSIVASPKI